MHSIEEKINELLEKQKEHSEIQENTKDELSLIRERIRAEEESTGDVVRDFILAYYLEQRGIEESIRFLEKDISNNQYKQVLIVKEEGIWHPPVYEPHMHYFQPPQGHMSKNEEENLGILKGNLNLNVREGNILIPTQKYVARGYNLMNITTPRKEGAQEGPIKINVIEFIYLNAGIPDVPCSVGGIVSTKSDIFHSLRILIGNELVESYYKLPSFFEKGFWELVERKQKGEEVIGEIERLTRGKKINSFYYKALELLGQKIPKEIQDEWDRKIYEKKLDIINNLRVLISKESGLVSEINKLYGRIDNRPQLGGRILYETGPSIPGPDEDIINIVSFQIRGKLEKTHVEIKEYLREALEMKMHEAPLILEGDKQGIKINVSEFISGLCKDYNLEIPN